MCGRGSLTAQPCGDPDTAFWFELYATFEFPQAFPWVPASDDFDANADQLGPLDDCD
jgi:hypothetical protein